MDYLVVGLGEVVYISGTSIYLKKERKAEKLRTIPTMHYIKYKEIKCINELGYLSK